MERVWTETCAVIQKRKRAAHGDPTGKNSILLPNILFCVNAVNNYFSIGI